jgi:hypothetical protein
MYFKGESSFLIQLVYLVGCVYIYTAAQLIIERQIIPACTSSILVVTNHDI